MEDRRLLTITVNTLVDEFDGVGATSLREAIFTAAPGETINFSVTGTINLTNLGQLVINKNLTINGPGANLLTINAFDPTPASNNGDGSRVFLIDDGNDTADKSISISGLTLTGGDRFGFGGAIASYENLTLTDSVITGNNAISSGGGIWHYGGELAINGSSISGNRTSVRGGGLYSIANVTIHGSTISGNTSTGGGGTGGGGIYSLGSLAVTNSTISGNTANNHGGGICVPSGTLTVRHSTITLNRNDADGNDSGRGGGVFVNAATATLDHTIVARNNFSAFLREDIFGAVSAQYSLIGDNTGATITDNGGNLIGTSASPIDPLLGSLADNGGTTKTHALLAGSPAIDAGDPAAVAGMGDVPEFEQRGAPFIRVADGDSAGGARIDIGAYERQTLGGPQSFVVDTLADEWDGNFSAGELSLREAIGLANGSIGAETIMFAAALTSGGPATILLSQGELAIRDSLTISGPGANLLTIDASGSDPTPTQDNGDGSRVFRIFDAVTSTLINVEINGLTLSGGDTSDGGGAIVSAETLAITSSTISGNNGEFGVVTSYYGNLTVTASTISGNSSFGVSNSYGNLTVAASTISGNGGGGVASGTTGAKTAIIINSTICGNSGRGVQNFRGLTIIRHSTITNNTAPSGTGSGVASFGDSLTRTEVYSSIIAGNTNSDVDFVSGGINSFQSNGYNVIGGGNAVGEFNQPGDQPGVINPMLGTLAENGGPTLTHALLAGSPAIDAGDPAAVAGVGAVPQFDQRGDPFRRVFNGDGAGGARIDIGAFELIPSDTVHALFGDYNRNFIVDAADYVVWRKTLGTTGVPAFSGADGDGDGMIDQDDFGVWRGHFGQILPGAASGAGAAAALPEVSPPSAQTVPAEPVAQMERASGEGMSTSLPVSKPNQAVESRGANVEVLAPRTSLPASYRPAVRPSFGAERALAASRRDDALVAWLASKPDTKSPQLEEFEEVNTWKDEDKSNTDDWHLDSVDQVFALLTSV